MFDTEVHLSSWNGVISGTGYFAVDDVGGVTLTNIGNTYSGGTSIYNLNTRLTVDDDRELGAPTGSVGIDQGVLQTSAGVSFNPSRTLSTNENSGALPGQFTQAYFDTEGNASSWNGLITGGGGFSVLSSVGSGSLTLTNQQENYLGPTNIGDYPQYGVGGPPPPLAGTTTLVLTVAGNLPSSTAVSIGYNGTFVNTGSLAQTIGSLTRISFALLDL